MRDLRVQEYEQIQAYTLIDLLSTEYFLALLNVTETRTLQLFADYIPDLLLDLRLHITYICIM